MVTIGTIPTPLTIVYKGSYACADTIAPALLFTTEAQALPVVAFHTK